MLYFSLNSIKSEILLKKINDIKQDTQKTNEAEEKIKILLYMDGLRTLIRRSAARNIKKKNNPYSVIECVNENIKISFADSNGK